MVNMPLDWNVMALKRTSLGAPGYRGAPNRAAMTTALLVKDPDHKRQPEFDGRLELDSKTTHSWYEITANR